MIFYQFRSKTQIIYPNSITEDQKTFKMFRKAYLFVKIIQILIKILLQQ